jgi:hypothetical protein
MRGDSMMLVSIFPFADFAHAIFLLPTAANDCAGMLPREKKLHYVCVLHQNRLLAKQPFHPRFDALLVEIAVMTHFA